MDTLKSSYNGYNGNFTRLYKEIEVLMKSRNKIAEVSKKRDKIIETFEKFQAKFEEIKEVAGEAGIDIQALILDHEGYLTNKNELHFVRKAIYFLPRKRKVRVIWMTF